MPIYKLTYFQSKGIAEPIRFLFNYAGIEFIDERVSKDVWRKIRNESPFGQVPVLEIDGEKVCQSLAICRYLAKQCGLYGKDDLEALKIDATVESIYDFRIRIAAIRIEEHTELKSQRVMEATEIVPFYIKRLDEQVKNNGGYLVGKKLTYADFVFVALLDVMNFVYGQNIIENAENLKALENKILAIPSIKAWIAKRPESDH